MAIKMGYTIIEIYQVLNYLEKNNTLFKKYVQTWLKTKQENSGWPSWCDNQQKKDEYIINYLDKEGIKLYSEKIMKNEGRRSIAKLMLNTLWGKFAQRTNLRKTVVVTDYCKYWEIINDDKLKICSEINPSDDIILLEYEVKDIENTDPGLTNIAVASFVTSYARLELYKLIQKIG
jgi:hypothetical protein